MKYRVHIQITSLIISAVMFIFSLIPVSGGALSASAASAYSNVLTDLMQDESFETSAYPVNNSDYSISVIQIAESASKELLVYVYQPCVAFYDHMATSINISFENRAKQWRNYKLELINRGGTLGKYRVDGVAVGDSSERIYDISSIYRKYNKITDAPAGGDNTISEKAFPVGQKWTATTVGDTVKYAVEDVEVLEVAKQTAGFRRYSGAMQWNNTRSCDAHYLAFSTNRSIDYLLSADVEFYTQEYKQVQGQDMHFANDREYHFVPLHYYDEGAFGNKRWSRVCSTRQFVDDVEIDGADKNVFLQYDWILNFYETDYTREAGGKDIVLGVGAAILGGIPGWAMLGVALKNALTTNGTIVSDVTLLRLEFVSDNAVYNLGVVSDKQTGSNTPVNQPDIDKQNKRKWLIFGLVAAGVVIIAVTVLSVVFPVLGKVVLAILRGLWWVICLPFRGIILLSEYIKRKQYERRINKALNPPMPKKKKKRKKAKAKK